VTVDLLPDPNDEQSMLLDASIRFMDTEMSIAKIRRRADGEAFDDDCYRRTAAELGWFGLLADEAGGGGSISGNGLADASAVAAERGARLQPGPFPGHSTVVHALTEAGGHEDLLAELVAGDSWATWVDDSAGRCRISEEATGLRLDGTVEAVAEGPLCRWFLISTQGPDGTTQALIDATGSGVTVRRLDALDVTRRWYAIDLNDVAVEPARIVGEPGAADALVSRQRQVAAVLTCAEMTGTMHADHEVAVQYAKDRIAFGRPIGSFQAVKHLLADASLMLEMSKGIVTAAANAVSNRADDGPQLAHAAKAFISERGVELAHACFQVYGGIGYTWEHDNHLFLRRITADAASFGSAGAHRQMLLDAAGVDR
jgi:alkylation response protein AidB-like acyl-CoA dehydrogenase